MPDTHARFSPSAANRRIHCPPSLLLEEQFEEGESVYAAEGTAGHALAEHLIRKHLKQRTTRPTSEYYKDELLEAVDEYVSFVIGEIEDARRECHSPVLLVEQRIDAWPQPRYRPQFLHSPPSIRCAGGCGNQGCHQLQILWCGACSAHPRAKKKVLLGCVLPKVVVRKSAGDSAEPECRLWGHLSELRESVHGLRKQSPALLLPCLLYSASIWKLCLSMINLIASA